MTLPDGEIFSETEWAEVDKGLSFSPRQAQITHCLFSGLGDKQIAAELNISVPTVRTHLSRLFAKLDVQDRCELILRILHWFRTGCKSAGCPRQQRHQKR